MKQIKTALISVFYKNNLDKIVDVLHNHGVQIYATGGTFDFIAGIDNSVKTVESLTGYPSILGGRVKTLHPKVFGGILGRIAFEPDAKQMVEYQIPAFDLVIVDLYPFEQTVATTDNEADIIEKIDIGGISLIRAGAKNYNDVLIVPSSEYYDDLLALMEEKNCCTELSDRRRFAKYAFDVSSNYDAAIYKWFSRDDDEKSLKISVKEQSILRYGENPHQKGYFYGSMDDVFTKLHGKEISYNNILDIETGLNLIREFDESTFTILKHNNPCGLASRPTVAEAYRAALAGDPVSAFGGVLVCNRPVDKEAAEEINKMFFEVMIAPDYEEDALELLFSKKNRIILKLKSNNFSTNVCRTALNGFLVENRDTHIESETDFTQVTEKAIDKSLADDLIFANKIVKHSRSNAITIAKNKQLLASGIGQTSRVDALKQAIAKAKENGFDLHGAVLASDAFFPFSDCVGLAHAEGIDTIIQPGGSVRDQESIDLCNVNGMAMVFTGYRHFKH